jgi:hypothetical protein
MGAFPRWNGLKHFYNVTTIKFTDGQSFYDILKVSLFLYFAARPGQSLTFTVYHSLYCWLASQELNLNSLYPSISILSNPCRLALYDRESHKADQICTQRL